MRCRVAVTGATGFIGGHLVTRLAERGDEVRGIVRPDSPRAAPAGLTVVRAPLQPGPLREAFDGADIVVHLAGVISALDPQAYNAINVAGTRAVASAAASVGARLVHISSLAAAGPAPATAPRCEEDVPNPLTPYGTSKLAGEDVVKSTPGLRWVVLRPGVVYGPGDRALWTLFRLASHGVLPLIGRCDAAYTFIYVDDAVRAIEGAIDVDVEGDVVFVGHPQPVTARRLLIAIQTALGGRAVAIRFPNAVARAIAAAGDLAGRIAARPMPLNRWRYRELSAEGFVCRVDRLRERLGVVAEVELQEGISRTAEWYRREGWI